VNRSRVAKIAKASIILPPKEGKTVKLAAKIIKKSLKFRLFISKIKRIWAN